MRTRLLRTRIVAGSATVLVAGTALVAGGPGLAATHPGVAGLAAPRPGPTLSITDRLGDRRYVVSGTRAYDVGTEAGYYPAMGWHTRGEMGGIWTPPLKLLDGLWFRVQDSWLGPATQFTSGYGYVGMRFPDIDGMRLSRTEFAPDGRRAVLVGLTMTNTGAERDVSLLLNAHSELMSAYPWGETTPSQLDVNLPDEASQDGNRAMFRDAGTPPGANQARHDWVALVGTPLVPKSFGVGSDFRGPQSHTKCPPSGPGTPPPPDWCDDTAYGQGNGIQFYYRLHFAAGETRTVWVTVAGSDHGVAAARQEYDAASAHPLAELQRKVTARLAFAHRSRVSLPGDPLLAEGVQWAKQNLADLVQVATDVKVRRTHEGTAYPAPIGTVPRMRFEGAGFPDYPWLFATDGEYTAFALVAAGRAGVVKDHLRALRAVSLLANGGSGKVVHEVVSDGSVYFGLNGDAGDTDETAKFPSTVALVWRWTGDDAFRDEMYGFVKRNVRYLLDRDDADHDLWPEGSGNVEAPGLGTEKLDVSVYTLRALYDLASMAASKGDEATRRWAIGKARSMARRFDRVWWMPTIGQHADSLTDPGNVLSQQRWWIGVTPMEAELYRGTRPQPGVTGRGHGAIALQLRQTSCYTGTFGLYVQGAAGCDPAPPPATDNRITFSLNTAVMAVGEGNYGRLGPEQQQRYTTDNRELMLPDPDEQPGALPEIAPSPDFVRNIDQPFTSRSMVMQAWGSYGLLWPVVHQQLGVRPDLGRGRLEVTPQVPVGQASIAGADIRVGHGSVDVAATHVGTRYTTTVTTTGVDTSLTIGHTLPRTAEVRSVTLNGASVPFSVRFTHRGEEVLVRAVPGRVQRLVVTRS